MIRPLHKETPLSCRKRQRPDPARKFRVINFLSEVDLQYVWTTVVKRRVWWTTQSAKHFCREVVEWRVEGDNTLAKVLLKCLA